MEDKDMDTIRNCINSHLNESYGYENREKYDELLYDWYGEDLSLFNPDDEDLAIAFNTLRMNSYFWQINPVLTSPYQRLKRKYDALLESFMQMIDNYKTICFENEQLALACQKKQRIVISVKTNGGSGVAGERRSLKHDSSDVA